MITLDEYFEATEARKFLVINLETNISVYCEEMTKADQEALLRMQLIVIRQYDRRKRG